MSLSIRYILAIGLPGPQGALYDRPVARHAPVGRDYRVLPPNPATAVLDTPTKTTPASGERRIRPIVALRLLEVIRDQDVPLEILEEEDPAVTLPRRLGLSEVVERQIRSYRDDVRRRVRLSDAEVRDLFRLVIRRPDAAEIFYKVGRTLAGEAPRKAWRRLLPVGLAAGLARGRVRRRLKRLFGRRMGGFGKGGFSIEGRSLLFIEADPGGEACAFLSGFCEAILEQVAGRSAHVTHTRCQGQKDPQCRWEGRMDEPVRDERAQARHRPQRADPASEPAE